MEVASIKKNKNIALSLIVGIAAFYVTVTLVGAVYKHTQAPVFPPAEIVCANQFMDIATNGYADPELNIPPFEYKNVIEFRCASKKGLQQYEISGIDNAGHTFYVHHSGGGVAASGADSYLDHCYISDGAVVKSIKIVGRDSTPEKGTCKFDEAFTSNPESTYSFTGR